jgi:hypothetical protein
MRMAYPFRARHSPAAVTMRTGQPCSKVIMGVYKPDGSLTWISINLNRCSIHWVIQITDDGIF